MADPRREPPRVGGTRGGTGQNRLEADSEPGYHLVGAEAGSLFNQEHPPAQPVATSVAAAEAIKPTVTKQRAEVFACIREHGPITDQRGSEMSGIDPSSWRPRRGEIEKAGLIVADGLGETASGRSATLWRVVGPAPAPPHATADWTELAKSRPGWMGRRAFDDLVAKAIAASNGDLQAARRRVARDLEGHR